MERPKPQRTFRSRGSCRDPFTCTIIIIIIPDWSHCAALSILRGHLPGGCPGKLHCHLHCVHFQENAGEQLTAFTRNCWLLTYKEYCQAQRSGNDHFLSGTKTRNRVERDTLSFIYTIKWCCKIQPYFGINQV